NSSFDLAGEARLRIERGIIPRNVLEGNGGEACPARGIELGRAIRQFAPRLDAEVRIGRPPRFPVTAHRRSRRTSAVGHIAEPKPGSQPAEQSCCWPPV